MTRTARLPFATAPLVAALLATAGLGVGCGAGTSEGHSHEEARFTATAAVSADALDVAVVPRSPYKLAVEFPFELRVAEPEPATHAAEVARERSEKRLHFSVPAAEGLVEAKVVFGICRGDDSICERVEHAFSVAGS
ncbi:MAG: hypothetical protein QNK05_12780 [Myxococcota bacterium]|nr:hypothetical protein [Myxococcota bacterium]